MIRLNKDKSYHFLLVYCNQYQNLSFPIFCLPCIYSIKTNYPNAKISLLIHSSMRYLLDNNPEISNILLIDSKHSLSSAIKEAKVDISISFTQDKKSTIALFLAKVKIRIGIFSDLHSFLFNYKIKQSRLSPKKHEIQYNLDLLKALNCQGIFFPKLYLTIQQQQQAGKYLESRFKSNMESNLIIIYPSKDGNSIGWEVKNFFSTANLLADDNMILIIANPSEQAAYETMLEQYSNLSKNNLYISNNQKQLLAIISYARLFVSNNTLLLHCASALGVQTLSLNQYSKHNNPMRYGIFSKEKHHTMLTPLGIFSYKNLDSIIKDYAKNPAIGLRLDNIQPKLVYDIIKAKLE
ncbi:lipopolysaccharide heptosyltransferase family protein [Helicobacter muridarum]|uniref:ADP-heptose-LPS-heptosyltransferase n=1 Tax=Helicobacter muridarum TaxID=216 RepID=A0A099TXI3_9HELI|nr:glycosyltransferase family 9 protein [Helicobacter muridarum]TLE01187.1 lipopolysaccharide heptosyltransferase family protein [Helicobacter muridarum]STQ86064.1 ADP-heptose-LPS-heptosyltransferase [Helicobacter muridarum]